MKFAAIVGVKDEVELIGPCLRHLRAIGIDQIMVMDAGSTDGTLDILQSYREDDILVVCQSDQDPDADAWGRTATALARNSGADWVIFLDADEFWMPAGGSLHGCRQLDESDVLKVDRYNVPVDRHGVLTADRKLPEGPREMLLVTRAAVSFRTHLEQNPNTPWIRGVPAPKVMARPELLAWVGDGFHDVRMADCSVPRLHEADQMFIAHFPFTTLRRFKRKIANIRRVFAVHDAYFGPDLAWHWRRWLALESVADIHAEFQRQLFDEDTLAALLRVGVVQSAADWYAGRVGDLP